MFSTSTKTSDPAANGGSGFTLIEMLLAMAIASITLAAVVSIFISLNKSYTTQSAAADVQQVIRAGIDFMAQNIRMAGLDPLEGAAAGFEDMSAGSIRFTADLNGNGTIDTAGSEDISYFLSGNQLLQSIDGGASVMLVDHVINLIFTYRDKDNAVTADPAEVRTVQISITVRESVGFKRTVERTYATRVRCRNLGL